jgi:Protein of unknown function (DUF5818)
MKRSSLLVPVFAATLALLPFASARAESLNGWITDDNCGAKGAKADHAKCAAKCLEKGAKLVFVTTDGHKIYKLDKQDLAKEHVGHQVTVTGEVKDDTIAVDTITMGAPAK